MKTKKKTTKKKEETKPANEEIESTKRLIGRIVAKTYQDMQAIRISSMNRIRDVIRRKTEGIKFDEVEKKKAKKNYEDKYKDENLLAFLQEVVKKGPISKKEYDYIAKCMEIADDTKKLENRYKKAMMDFVKEEPIYLGFLSQISGIGSVLSANLIKEFGDCRQYETVSKLWAHSGQSVDDDGKAPVLAKGKEIHYSPKLRTFVWLISDCLMKSNKGLYRKIYDTEKKRQSRAKFKKGELFKRYGKPYTKDDTKLSKLHVHNRALRKMRKMFLSHYWACAREMAGLETREIYVIEKLGHTHLVTWKDALKKEKNG